MRRVGRRHAIDVQAQLLQLRAPLVGQEVDGSHTTQHVHRLAVQRDALEVRTEREQLGRVQVRGDGVTKVTEVAER